ncbi:MAG TPA: hypothetical protein VLJ18_02820 [Thermoanaerobaculia bacterium]|nr:hypothetical protein [Thermoanaerobaculia bacterium]
MSDPIPSPSRRLFAKSLALAAAAPALAGAATALGQAAPAPSPASSPVPSPVPVPTPEAPSSVAEALTEVVRIRWGRHLSGEQLGEIAKALDGRLRGAEAMKKVSLTNADEPDVVFFAELPGGR